MLNIVKEELLPLKEAARRLPRCRSGKKISVATLYRWSSPKGCRGVRLETARVGSARVTSVEALQRFVDRLTERDEGGQHTAVEGDARKEVSAQVERELDIAGL